MKTKSFAPAILCMGICLLFLATAATAMSRYHVRAGASGDGSTWAQAGGDLQAAIDSGVSEVWVAAGIYSPSSWPNGGSSPREVHFALRDGVTVLGGFPDKGDPVIEDRDPAMYPTFCSGDIGTIGVPSDNAYHVFYHPPAITGSAVLDGVTITAGNASDSGINGQGAGMYNSRSSPTLIRCVFLGNTAKFEGGGVYQTTDSETSFEHCVFYQNSSDVAGGGVYNELSKTIFSHCVFVGNTAPFGGAIRNLNSSSSQILSCTFHNNTGFESGGGGGIHNETDSSAEVSNSILWGDSGGEVVDLTGCVSIVQFCTIQGGWTGDGGDNSSSDPLFAGSGVPDGPDHVWATGDDGLRLTGSSPALDMGSAALLAADTQDLDRDGIIMEPSPFDLRMLARIAGTGLDQGAYEFQYPTVTFELAGHASRVGGGDLVQELKEGTDATAPILAVDLGWIFNGWDQLFTHVFADRTVTALYTATFAPGSICYVRQGGTGNGTTWDLAAGNIQQAIDAISAAGGGQVWVAAGTYLPSSWPNGGTAAREKHFSLRNGVTVLGGFPATGTPGVPDRNPPACPTLLSGDLGVVGDTSDNAYHVFYHSGITLNSSARLDGVTITGGKADGSGVHEYGAGMFNSACSPTLVRCVFTANASAFQAGGLYLGSSSATVVNCVFANNSANNEGGALYTYQSTPAIANCLFSGNTAQWGSAAFLYLGGPSSFQSCTFSGNSSVSASSTIHLSSSTATLSNCIVWNNSHSGIGPLGATLNYCIIEGGWTGSGSNNLGTDPLFANAGDPEGADNRWATADDGLHPGAPGSAFNSGDPSLLPADLADIDGDADTVEALPLELASQPRIRGAQLDRGAYETSATIIYHVRSGGIGNGLTWANAMGDPQDAIAAAAIEGNSQVWIAAGIYLPDSWPNGGSTDREKHFALRNGVAVFGGFPGTGTPAMIDHNPALNLTVFSGDLGVTGVNTDNAYHVFYHPDAAALDDSALLDGVTITAGNASTGKDHLNGAGMYNSHSSPTLVRCHFLGNTATERGGGIFLYHSVSSIVNCIFSGNSADDGGACSSSSVPNAPTWTNCVFYNNSAVTGGAASLINKTNPRFFNCTFVANSGSSGGGAIFNASLTVLDNSIFWGNAPNQIHQDIGGTATLNYCIIQGGWSGAGSNNTSADPLFANAGDPDGADGLWGTADDGLQPSATSPAVNGGSQALLPLDLTDIDADGDSAEVLPFDLNLRPRVRDVQVDRGAYEPLSPVIFHVKSGGTGNGFTWATAMGDPQAAIEAAATATNSQVWIASGIYQPSSWPNGGSAPREKHFALRNGVPVYGGFPAIGDPGLIDRNPATNAPVLSGDIGTPDNADDNVYHVFYHPAGAAVLDSSARLDGVVIIGGNANQLGGHESGGGMFNDAGSPALLRCRFQSNNAYNRGGGLHLGQSTSSVINCIFTGNTASLGGAGFIYQGAPIVANCVFIGNGADAGAGLYNYSGLESSQVLNCTFASNIAGGFGGAVYTYLKPIAFKNCILWANSPGPIFQYNGTATLDYCIVQGGWGGAGTNNTSADPLFINAGDPDGADNQWVTADDGLQPAAASPAINSGDQTLLPLDLTDMDGDGNIAEVLPGDLNMRPRVRDVQVDRGAYEPPSPMIFHVRSGFTGNGFTWATAMGDPQAAIEAAVTATNSQVWIAAGIYRPVSWPNGGSAEREKHFSLRNNVPVYGGFPSAGDPGMLDRNPAANPTVFSADIGAPDITADNAYHVFYHPSVGLDASARLDGVIITCGNANGSLAHESGAGMYIKIGSPTLVRCRFQSNSAFNRGGGIYLETSGSSLIDCVFADNFSWAGGAVFNHFSTPVMANCVFTGNTASNRGAALYTYQPGTARIINCTFSSNTANVSGGVVSINNNSPVFDNCILWNNTSNPIESMVGTATLNSCIIQGGWSGAGSNNIDVDPVFVNVGDPAGADGQWGTSDDGLRLVLPSPAIQAGNPALLPADLTDLDDDGNVAEALPLDLIGNARVTDVLPDAGAYEFVPGAMSLAYWCTLHFSAADRADPAKEATVWGNHADPDGDGVPNSGEYLLLLNPAACDNPLGQLEVIEWLGMRWLLLDYTVGNDRTGVALTIEHSAGLSFGSWTDIDDMRPSFPHYLIDETSSTRTWELLVPMYEARGFVRMGFTANP